MLQEHQLRQRTLHFKEWSNKRYGAFNSLKKIIKICTLAVAYSIISKPVHVKAQTSDTADSRIYELEEITVQSTLIEQKNAETGRCIEIIRGSQLQSLPVHSIDELLRYIPGLEAMSRNAFGVQTDFSIRGSNFNQVLVLIDGIKINDPTTAHFNSNIPVSPSEIDRIEIIRGPASIEYGPDATGGIINIITKTFSQNRQTSPLEADAMLLRGEENLYSSQAGFTYSTDRFGLGGGLLLNKSEGQLLQTGLRNYFDINTFSLSGRFQLNSVWSIALHTSQDYRDFNAQRFYSLSPLDSANEKIVRYRQQIQLLRKSERYSTTINVGYLTTDDKYWFTPSSIPANNHTQFFSSQINQDFLINQKFSLAVGALINQRSIQSNNRGNHSLFHTGIFTGFLLQPFKPFTLNTSLRADYDESYGLYILPQFSLSYEPLKNLLLRTSEGKSIRAADFTENYYNTQLKGPLPTTYIIGNPYLKAEQSWSTEMGLDYNFMPGIIFSTTVFSRWSNNLIDYVLTPSQDIKNNSNLVNGNYLYARNISNLCTYGIETRVGIHKNISDLLKVSVVTGYTIQKSANKDSIISLYISSHAKQLINAEFTLGYGPFSIEINGLYKQRNTQFSQQLNISLSSDYTIWNASLDYSLYRQNVQLTVTADNVFDVRYSDILGAEMPHRWIMGGVKIKL
jgi:iron complex outermembrane receptor protein